MIALLLSGLVLGAHEPVVSTATHALPAAGGTYAWRRGPADPASAGVLAFAPDGVLLMADPTAAALWAFDTEEPAGDPSRVQFALERLDDHLAGLLGTTPDRVSVQDLAIHPLNGFAWLSVTRGEGEEARPALVRVDDEGELRLLDLSDVRHARAELPNAPAADGRATRRAQSITDLVFLGDRVVVAGLSNEEFASKLRSVPFPLGAVASGTSVEIYHGAHGAWETRAPVRTLVPVELDGEPHLVAAYTCTPLVRFPLSVLDGADGAKVRGTTVAELGGGNRPLDMITYERDGETWLLVANSRHGLLKVSTAGLGTDEGITELVERTAGLAFEPVEWLEGVVELDRVDDDYVVVLLRTVDSKRGTLLTVETP